MLEHWKKNILKSDIEVVSSAEKDVFMKDEKNLNCNCYMTGCSA